jgi:hypothetical protein
MKIYVMAKKMADIELIVLSLLFNDKKKLAVIFYL